MVEAPPKPGHQSKVPARDLLDVLQHRSRKCIPFFSIRRSGKVEQAMEAHRHFVKELPESFPTQAGQDERAAVGASYLGDSVGEVFHVF